MNAFMSIVIWVVLCCSFVMVTGYNAWKGSSWLGTARCRDRSSAVCMSSNQFQLMQSDQLICVNQHDQLIDVQSKKHCHMFTKENPVGLTHRAFSVFIFNAAGKMLLHQRASSKITFPSVWTNACCSHPLYPQEMDEPQLIADGSIPGIRKAAIRKLQDELGIDPSLINPQDFRFLTRIFYYAVDQESISSGKSDGFAWGENEIDYILFLRGDFPLQLNPEEVQNVQYVDLGELRTLLQSPDRKWSPWFHSMATNDNLLPRWWKNLDEVFHSHTLEDHSHITYLSEFK